MGQLSRDAYNREEEPNTPDPQPQARTVTHRRHAPPKKLTTAG